VVMPVGPAVSEPIRWNSQNHKNDHQQHRDDVLLLDGLYH